MYKLPSHCLGRHPWLFCNITYTYFEKNMMAFLE